MFRIEGPVALTAWDALVPLAMRHLVDCPIFLVEDELKRAGSDFLRGSHAWRSGEVVLATTAAATRAYAFTPPTGASLWALHSAWTPDDEMDIEQPGEADDTMPATTDGTKWKVGLRAGNSVVLSPIPSVAGVVITGTASYELASGATGIPTAIFDQWGPEIGGAAAARLMRIPRKPWSDPGTAKDLMGDFEGAMRDAAVAAGPVAKRRPRRVRIW